MTDEEKAEEYADKILFDSKYPFIFNKEKVKAYIIKVYLDSLRCCEEAYNKGLAEGRKEFEEKISVLLSCKNCSENKGGWICVKEYENKCLAQKIEFIKELKKENAVLKKELKIFQRNWQNQKNISLDANLSLHKAKDIIKKFSEFVNNEVEIDPEHPQEYTNLWVELCEKAEQFLNSEVEE